MGTLKGSDGELRRTVVAGDAQRLRHDFKEIFNESKVGEPLFNFKVPQSRKSLYILRYNGKDEIIPKTYTP